MIDLKELRAKAEISKARMSYALDWWTEERFTDADGELNGTADDYRFLAAMSPPTALMLLDEIDRLGKELKTMREACHEWAEACERAKARK